MNGGHGREKGDREREGGGERERASMCKTSKFEVTGCSTTRTERLYISS
jgi:hypothetical protein